MSNSHIQATSPPLRSNSNTTNTPDSSKHKRRPTGLSSPTTTTTMPRPLHLALGSVVGSSSSSPSTPGSVSPCPSPGPSRIEKQLNGSGDGDTPGLNLVAGSNSGDTNVNTPNTSRAPSPSPLSPAITGLKRHPNSSKRSSISYIPSTPNGFPSPSHSQGRPSLDGVSNGFVRSPLSSTHPPTSFSFYGPEDSRNGEQGGSRRHSGAEFGLTRSNSLGTKGPRTPTRGPTFDDKSPTTAAGSKGINGLKEPPSHLKERPPVTLAEKHAELLHFIAQKESKCLELRSQLAVHEAELLQLKRKWERIVNRGFERSMSPTNPSSSSSTIPLSASLSSTSPTSPSACSPNNNSTASYFPGLGPAGAVPGAVVLEGIKGGVQGMSRLIAAGIESIVLVNGPQPASPHDVDASTSSKSTVSSRTDRKDRNTGTVRGHGHGHGQKESQSSSSTTASSSSMFSTLSASSAATSISASSANGSSTTMTTTKKTLSSPSATGSTVSGFDADAEESEFGEFEEGRASLTLSNEGDRQEQPLSLQQDEENEHEQVLMVDDTGATPTMSPNPHFRRRRRKEKLDAHLEIEKLVLSPPSDDGELSANSASGKKEKKIEDVEFDWDDGWDEPVGKDQVQEKERQSGARSPSLGDAHVKKTLSMNSTASSKTKSPSSLNLPLPLAPVLGGQTTQQMSSWVGSVGKKWDEIKGSSTFTKSSKRASLLLTDMQNSIVSALISPPPPSSSTPSQPTSKTSTPSTSKQTLSSFSSNASPSFSRPPRLSPSLTPVIPSKLSQTQSRSTTSLLDDSDGELFGGLPSTGGIMVPDSLGQSSSASGLKKTGSLASAPVVNSKVVDDDEWNW